MLVAVGVQVAFPRQGVRFPLPLFFVLKIFQKQKEVKNDLYSRLQNRRSLQRRNSNDRDKEFVKGFDFCAENAVVNFFDSIDVYEDELDIPGEDIDIVRIIENREEIKDALQECLKDWMEHTRDELITSTIDSDYTDKDD